MEFNVRQATPKDAQGIYNVAFNRSRANMVDLGYNDKKLSELGFILYPLHADDPAQPNYLERIKASDHFWVATTKDEDETVIAFRMAYTFETMRQLLQKTKNDEAILEYFSDYNPKTLYLAQSAKHLDYIDERGIMPEIANHFLASANSASLPQIICEIAKAPMENSASSKFAKKTGFVRSSERKKLNPENGTERTSQTWLQTLPSGFTAQLPDKYFPQRF